MKQAGITEEQIRTLIFYQRSDAFDKKEKATIRYADQVTRGSSATTSRTLEELQKFYTEDEIVELTLVICITNFTNLFSNALQVEPELG